MEPPYVPTSAEMVTEDWLKKVLAGEFSQAGGNVFISKMEVTPGALRTEGFMSRLQRIFVRACSQQRDSHGEDGDGDDSQREFHLVAKLHPPGEVHRKIVRNIRAFEREIHVYHTFQRMVLEQQGDALCDHQKVGLPIPKLYFQEIGMDAACIVMEDLKHSGFCLNDKQLGMTYTHAKLCIIAEATFNALGYNTKKHLGLEEFLCSNGELLIEALNGNFGLMMDLQMFPGNIAFARGQNRGDLAERLEEFCMRRSPYQRMVQCIKDRGHMATFSHGDCWNNNYMFRFKKDTEGNEVPVEVKILDLQVSRYCNPTLDLAAFLLCNMEADVRDRHLDEFIELYYETLALTLERLQTPEWSRNVYSFDDFKREMADAWEYGFVVACWLVPLILSEDEDLPDLDQMTEDNVTAFFGSHEERMTTKANQNLIRRFTQVLEFGVKYGII